MECSCLFPASYHTQKLFWLQLQTYSCDTRAMSQRSRSPNNCLKLVAFSDGATRNLGAAAAILHLPEGRHCSRSTQLASMACKVPAPCLTKLPQWVGSRVSQGPHGQVQTNLGIKGRGILVNVQPGRFPYRARRVQDMVTVHSDDSQPTGPGLEGQQCGHRPEGQQRSHRPEEEGNEEEQPCGHRPEDEEEQPPGHGPEGEEEELHRQGPEDLQQRVEAPGEMSVEESQMSVEEPGDSPHQSSGHGPAVSNTFHRGPAASGSVSSSSGHGPVFVNQEQFFAPAEPALRVTAGMMELVGIALSLFMIKNYLDGHGPDGGDVGVSVYSDNVPMVDFAVAGGETDAGAEHLGPLVRHVQNLRQGILNHQCVQGGIWMARCDQGREAHNIRVADEMARRAAEGLRPPDAWPPGLEEDLHLCCMSFARARGGTRAIMQRY